MKHKIRILSKVLVTCFVFFKNICYELLELKRKMQNKAILYLRKK